MASRSLSPSAPEPVPQALNIVDCRMSQGYVTPGDNGIFIATVTNTGSSDVTTDLEVGVDGVNFAGTFTFPANSTNDYSISVPYSNLEQAWGVGTHSVGMGFTNSAKLLCGDFRVVASGLGIISGNLLSSSIGSGEEVQMTARVNNSGTSSEVASLVWFDAVTFQGLQLTDVSIAPGESTKSLTSQYKRVSQAWPPGDHEIRCGFADRGDPGVACGTLTVKEASVVPGANITAGQARWVAGAALAGGALAPALVPEAR